MTLDTVKLPSFRQAQTVMFLSGEGIVKSHKHEGRRWNHPVETALDIKHNFDRTGVETMALLSEADVHAA